MRGSADLVRGVAPSAALPGPTGESLVLEGAEIDPTRPVFGGTTVGRDVTIGAGARVDGSMLFDGAVVGAGARVVQQSVVGAGRAGRGGRHAVATRWSATGPSSAPHCELRRGMRIWPDVVLPPHGVRFSADV